MAASSADCAGLIETEEDERTVFSFTKTRLGEAALHLFRLAGGLESRIPGEDQIITQVNGALQLAREQVFFGQASAKISARLLSNRLWCAHGICPLWPFIFPPASK